MRCRHDCTEKGSGAMTSSKVEVRVRRARSADARRIAELSGQLGYPTTEKQMKERLRDVIKDREATCFVALSRDGGLIGWIHVSTTSLLEVERRAEVNGLVVDETARSRGAGALLLAAGEKWARGKRCKGMSVRSNVLRERAHGFYLRSGFEHYKTQKAFRKGL
jgi:N-acetylglutamate synthase-like GNAT family acetyltransferase